MTEIGKGTFVVKIQKVIKEFSAEDFYRYIEKLGKCKDNAAQVKNEYGKRLKILYEQGKECALNGDLRKTKMYAELYLNVERIVCLLERCCMVIEAIIFAITHEFPLEDLNKLLEKHHKSTKYFEVLKEKQVLEHIDKIIQSKQINHKDIQIFAQLQHHEPFYIKPITAYKIRTMKKFTSF